MYPGEVSRLSLRTTLREEAASSNLSCETGAGSGGKAQNVRVRALRGWSKEIAVATQGREEKVESKEATMANLINDQGAKGAKSKRDKGLRCLLFSCCWSIAMGGIR